MRAPPCVCEYKNDGAPQDRHRLRTSLQLCAPPTKRMRNQSRPGAATLDHHTGARERVPKAVVLASSTTTRKQEHPRKPSASVPGTCSNRDRCEMRARRALAAWRVRVLRRLEAPQRSVSLHHDERSATERARFVRELKNKTCILPKKKKSTVSANRDVGCPGPGGEQSGDIIVASGCDEGSNGTQGSPDLCAPACALAKVPWLSTPQA
jgi:hypothetical protein